MIDLYIYLFQRLYFFHSQVQIIHHRFAEFLLLIYNFIKASILFLLGFFLFVIVQNLYFFFSRKMLLLLQTSQIPSEKRNLDGRMEYNDWKELDRLVFLLSREQLLALSSRIIIFLSFNFK